MSASLPPPGRPQLEPKGPWSSPWLWLAVTLGCVLFLVLILFSL